MRGDGREGAGVTFPKEDTFKKLSKKYLLVNTSFQPTVEFSPTFGVFLNSKSFFERDASLQKKFFFPFPDRLSIC